MIHTQNEDLILLTGATGYIGGRLLSELDKRRKRLRCITRNPEKLLLQAGSQTEVIYGDVQDKDSLRDALAGVQTAFYLVHSLANRKNFENEEAAGARNFAEAASDAGIEKLIYLGGLGQGEDLSPHLASRHQVGSILAASGVPTLEFRAGIIIGSGSFSFEMIRALVDRLPIMITPRWTATRTQPIAVEDVITYLLEALEIPLTEGKVVEIGGPDRVSYAELMLEYARQRGLRRVMVPVPVLSPTLSSLWLGLVTPVFARIGRKLVEGLRNETVVEDDTALRIFKVQPRGIAAAIERALHHEGRSAAQSTWASNTVKQ
jgi:uncharacterized protein YbjT (DUF2867 family)